MDRISREIANSKQEKIQVVKSQPSAATLREGQEVMYITKDNRLARYRKEQGRLWVSYMDSDLNRDLSISGNINLSRKLITSNYPAFRVYIDDQQTWGTGAYSKVEFEEKNRTHVVDQYDNGSNIDYTNDYFIVPYAGIYHFNCNILFEDAQSEEVDAGESVNQILYVDSNGNGSYSDSHDELIFNEFNVHNVDLAADRYWTSSMAAECKLSAGDKVQWAVNNTTGATIEPYNQATNDTKYNMFTGHLVCAL
jgi:plastocyanin|tara:strand:+ start:1876 stop:2631 length:756 start_codon:yes stop_codon:yes gene_type:complete